MIDAPVAAPGRTSLCGAALLPSDDAFALALADALAALPPRLRTPLTLHHVRGLPADRIATVLGCPLGDVRRDLARGRGLLRAHVRAHEYARATAGI